RGGMAGFLVLIAISLFFASGAVAHYNKADEVVDQQIQHDNPDVKTTADLEKYRAEHAKEVKDATDAAGKANPHIAPHAGLGRFFYAYVIGWSWILSIALGSLLYVLIHHAVKAKWSVTTRRLAEILAGTLPIIFVAGLVFIIPILAGNKTIYFWAHPAAHF